MTMTAVAVQQNSYQSRPQTYASSASTSVRRQEPPMRNGTTAAMNPRQSISNESVRARDGEESDTDRATASRGLVGRTNGDTPRDRRLSLQDRPVLAPKTNGESSQDDSERERPRRRPKPLLQRSKSDYGPRGEEPESQVEEEIQDWGARHGFEDHYASEEYVSQLANVGCSFPPCLHAAHRTTCAPSKPPSFRHLFFLFST